MMEDEEEEIRGEEIQIEILRKMKKQGYKYFCRRYPRETQKKNYKRTTQMNGLQ